MFAKQVNFFCRLYQIYFITYNKPRFEIAKLQGFVFS